MRSVLRYSAIVAMANVVIATRHRRSDYMALGEMPTQTVMAGGPGLPIFEVMATPGPSLELLKKRVAARAETNTCTEWTILGGNGQPVCYNGQTCLFSTVGDYKYEGCGSTSFNYDWITECYNYPKTGSAGPSQTFCSSTAPACGVFEFRFDSSITFSNFGCDTASYSYIATLLPTTGSVDLAIGGAGTSKSTIKPSGTVVVATTPTNKIDPTNFPGTDITPAPKSSTPVGAIVGGAIGGVAVIAILGFMAWYCVRRRKRDKEEAAASAQQQADAATAAALHQSTQTRMQEMDGSSTVKPGVGAFAPPPPGNHFAPTPEKDGMVVGNGAVDYRPGMGQHQYSSNYGETPISANTGSPPPVYNQPTGQVGTPSSQFTELDNTQGPRHSVAGSPLSAGANTYTGSGNVSELGVGDHRSSYQPYQPGSRSHTPLPELGDEISSSSGGINRRPVGQQQPGVDMSGAPMSQDYSPRHELP